MKNCTLRRRLCMEDLWSLIFTSKGSHYCVGLVNDDLWYSGPWLLKTKVTSGGAKGWKDLCKSFWSVTTLSAPQTLQSVKGKRMTLCSLHFAVVSDKLDFSSTERKLDKENYNFYCINKSVYVTRAVPRIFCLRGQTPQTFTGISRVQTGFLVKHARSLYGAVRWEILGTRLPVNMKIYWRPGYEKHKLIFFQQYTLITNLCSKGKLPL